MTSSVLNFMSIYGGTYQLLDGYAIPRIGLGTYTLWSQSDVDYAVDAALSSGYRLFDTANFYQNENELGNSFKKLLPKYSLVRENIYIITKANIRSSNVEENAKSMIDNSLKSLQTEYLDLILIHYPKDWGVDDKERRNKQDRLKMYQVFETYKDQGKIRSIGVSNFEVTHIDELWDIVKHRPVLNQCEFHPYLTRKTLRNYCRSKRIFFQAHTSLAKNSRSLYNESAIVELAVKYKCSVQQVLLAFAYHQGVGVIPKSVNPERIAKNMQIVSIDLTTDEIEKLNRLNKDKHYSDCDGWNVI